MKKVLSLVLAVIMILSVFSVLGTCVLAAGSDIHLTATVNSNKCYSKVIDGVIYIFLPSSANLNALEITSGGKSVQLFGEDISSGAVVDVVANSTYDEASGCYIAKAGTAEVRVMKSEKVGAMYITTENTAYGRAWVENCDRLHKTNDAAKYTNVNMYLEEADGNVIYNGKLTQIKGRGNSTWGYIKKPYQIKLDKKTDLINSGDSAKKNKTWVLLANAFDKTLIRNAFSLDIAKYLGLVTPNYKYIELFYDGEYRGSYLVCEKVQINTGRLEIKNLEDSNTVEDETAQAVEKNSFGLKYYYNPTATCSDDITGGYLLEEDTCFYNEENSWFETPFGSEVVIKSPEFCTKEQAKYISELFCSMCKAAENGKYNSKKFSDYADVESFAADYVLNEYTANYDFMISSTYFFLPEKGNAKYENKFYAGPAWDFDCALGIKFKDTNNSRSDATHINFYDKEYFKNEEIRSTEAAQWKKIENVGNIILSKTPVKDESTGISSLAMYRNTVEASRKMNFTIWPFDSVHLAFAYPSYDENYEYLESFVNTRHNAIMKSHTCSHLCHKTDTFSKLIWNFVLVFIKLFNANQHCSCGLRHY